MTEKFVDPAKSLILRVCGAVFTIWSLPLLIAPMPTIGFFMRITNPGEGFDRVWANSSMLAYMFRTSGVTCLWIGISFLIAAKDPAGYAGWVKASGVMLVLLCLVGILSSLLHPPVHPILIADAILAGAGGLVILRFSMNRKRD